MKRTVVIGSGIAGLNAALVSARFSTVILITKDKIDESATRYAQGGIASVLAKDDNFGLHFKDTIRAGAYHNNKAALNFLVEMGPASIRKLQKLGVHFNKKKEKLELTKEGGHSRKRIAFVADKTGEDIEETLIEKVKANKKIIIYEKAMAKDLIIVGGICKGVELIHDGKLKFIPATATIIATGGVGEIYANTTNPNIATGDGIAMAYRAGARLKDLEFMQFHPTALNIEGKQRFLLSEAMRGEGAYLLNSKEERFMHLYDKRLELAPRDIVSRAVHQELKKGPVYLDISHMEPDFVKVRFPTIYAKLKTFDLDTTKQPIPIAPAAHYMCGGVRVDIGGATSIQNLFAFGETACTGVHGANRLASNSLLEGLVFSEQLKCALKKIKPAKANGSIVTLENIGKITKEQKNTILETKREIKDIMWENVGIVRNEKGLNKAITRLNQIKDQIEDLPFAEEKVELNNMATTGLLMARYALRRKRNMGCHYRADGK